MKAFKDVVKEYDDFTSLGGASEAQIEKAEKELNVKFNEEYRDFLKECGSACANGHEFTGICNTERLSIVTMTQRARQKNPNIPLDLYVIESVGIDKILTWQNTSGELFQNVAGNLPERLKDNLCEYLNN